MRNSAQLLAVVIVPSRRRTEKECGAFSLLEVGAGSTVEWRMREHDVLTLQPFPRGWNTLAETRSRNGARFLFFCFEELWKAGEQLVVDMRYGRGAIVSLGMQYIPALGIKLENKCSWNSPCVTTCHHMSPRVMARWTSWEQCLSLSLSDVCLCPCAYACQWAFDVRRRE